MELQTILSAKIGNTLEYFPEFGVRLENDGFSITARSPLFAELMNTLCPPSPPTPKTDESTMAEVWRGQGLRLSKGPLFGPYFHHRYAIRMDHQEENSPNLFWLTHPKLASGCKVHIKEPVSLNDLEEYFTDSCDLLRKIYMNHLRTVEFAAMLKEVFA